MYSKQEVIEKVLKLMDQTTDRGATEAEAITAALIAQKLMNEYDIRQNELHSEEEELIVDKTCDLGSKKSFYKSLAAVIAPNFRCKAYNSRDYDGKNYAHFYGYESDAEAANITFKHLYALGNKLANRECRVAKAKFGTTTGVYNSFALGFINGVQSELEKQSKALLIITPKEVNDKFDDDFKDTRWRRGRATSTNYLHVETYSNGRQAAVDGIRSRRIGGRKALGQ